MHEAISASGRTSDEARPSFSQALVANVTGLGIALGLVLLLALAWQALATTAQAAREEISNSLDRASERLQILLQAAELTADSAERAIRWPPVTSATLRERMELSLAAFEQRPELNYLGIALPDTGEYGNLERTASGEILLWLLPGQRQHDPVQRNYLLTSRGFELRDERPSDGYDPRERPFYRAALEHRGGTWVPTYQWIVHPGSADPVAEKPLWGLSYMKAVHGEDGKLLAVLDTDFDLAALNSFVTSLGQRYDATLRIIELGETPRLLAGPGMDREPGAVPPDLARLARRDSFAGRPKIDGRRQWTAVRQLELKGGSSWLIVATRDTPLIAAPLLSQLRNVFGMGLALLLGLMLVALRMSRRLAKPLAELEQRVAGFGRGADLPPAPGSSGFRETQLLDTTFNKMAAAIRQQQAQLQGFNAELEKRVADRTRELQALNQELESFTHSVSHDLRAPLRAISGFSGILASDHAAVLDDTGRNYLQRLRNATERMNELIEDLLDLSRVSRGPMSSDIVDLSAIAREVLAILQRNDPQRRVDVQVADGVQVRGDAGLLRILLDNLLGNAWKFTSRTPEARITFAAGPEPGSFVISDNGAGFDMQYAGKLFGPFQRLHREAEFPGTGIGLATVQRIVNRHGGRIQAEAQPDKGATFKVWLPG